MFGWTTKDLTVKIVPSGLIWDSLMKKDSVTSVIMERNVCQCDSLAMPKVVAVSWQVNESALANGKGKYSWLQWVNVWLVMLLLWRILLILLPSWYLVGKRGIISLRSYCLTSVIIEVVMKGFPPAPLRSVWGFFEVSRHESENMTNTAGWGLILIFLFGCFLIFFLILIFYFFMWLSTIHFDMLSSVWSHEGTDWIRLCWIVGLCVRPSLVGWLLIPPGLATAKEGCGNN